jgi:hypothetical protein
MQELLTTIFKNMGCSRCQEFEFHEKSDKYIDWKLYLKEYNMYSAMILYNDKLKKDISSIIKKNESVNLLKEDGTIYIKLEYVANNDEENISVFVPTDEYQELYQSIESMDKKFDDTLKAYYIGTFNLKIVK